MKNFFKKLLFENEKFKNISSSCSAQNNLLPNIICRSKSNELRKIFNLPESDYFTQLNQDFFALLINSFKRNLFFIEIGANDGYDLSNTIYLEENFGWNGLLIEPNPNYFNSLKRRKSKHVPYAVSDVEHEIEFLQNGLYGGISEFIDKSHTNYDSKSNLIKVKTKKLEEILIDNNCPNKIDFISIDVEGAELSILKQFPSLKNYRFKCGCIEHNYRIDDYNRIKDFLEESGYKIIWNDQTEHDLFFIDTKS